MPPPGRLPPSGPPYAPQTASSGGVPNVIPDIPVTAVFLLLYIILFVVHLNIDKRNRQRKPSHVFIFSRAMLAFCVIRVATMALRITWACMRKNLNVGIAAQIFVYVGTVILFIMNWFFAQRIVRAQHPRWGWSLPYRIVHRAALAILICCLLMLVTVALQSFFTLDKNIHNIDRRIQLTGLTYFTVFSFAPVLVVIINVLIPRHGNGRTGQGSMKTNMIILVIACTILTLGASFRAGTSYLDPVLLSEPSPWYFSSACFYIFYFTTEVIVVGLYAWTRFDLRFWVPDGASKVGHYGEQPQPEGPFTNLDGSSELTLHMYKNDDLFSDTATLADSLNYGPSTLQLDEKTGAWKVKRSSNASSSASTYSRRSRFSTNTFAEDDIPAMPNDIPAIPVWNRHVDEVRLKRHSHLIRSDRGIPLEHKEALSRLTGSDRKELDDSSLDQKECPPYDSKGDSTNSDQMIRKEVPTCSNQKPQNEGPWRESSVRPSDSIDKFEFGFDTKRV